MRNIMMSVALAALMTTAGTAFAEVTTGIVKSTDLSGPSVTLDGGTVYTFETSKSEKVSVEGFKAGDMVTITWVMSGDKHMASGISTDVPDVVTGKIKAINLTDETATLDDGVVYAFPEKTDLSGVRVGDMVSLVTLKQSGTNAAWAIEARMPEDVTGKIAAVSLGNLTVTLDDGMVYQFHNDQQHKVDLGGFKTGDKVRISAVDVGGTHWGRAISSAKG